MSSITELNLILDRMDIPHNRRDVSKIDNVKWLARNLGVRNAHRPDIARALEIIKDILAKND